jgi:hypothetical protein
MTTEFVVVNFLNVFNFQYLVAVVTESFKSTACRLRTTEYYHNSVVVCMIFVIDSSGTVD